MPFKTRTFLFLKGIDAFACTSFPLGSSLRAIYEQTPQTNNCVTTEFCGLLVVGGLCGLAAASKAGCKLQQHVAYPNALGFREHYCGTEFSCQNCYSLFHRIV